MKHTHIALVLLIALLTLPSDLAIAGDLDGFTGTWVVDVNRTMAEATNSPKFVKDGPPPPAFTNMLAKMKISLTETNFTFIRGTSEEKMPTTVESVSATNAVLTIKMGSREARLTFRLVDNKFMNFKSSVSDDMNFFIWKKPE